MAKTLTVGLSLVLVVLVTGRRTVSAQPAQAKPNTLVIMGDDICFWNLSTNN